MADTIRLLLAEDYDIIREDLQQKLNAQPDMEVVGTASSGAEIVELARHVPADIILMDMEMEDMYAGTRATEAILAEDPEVDVIFLTIHEAEDMVLAALAASAVDYLIKTDPLEVILEHIRNVHRGAPQLEPRLQAYMRNEFLRMKGSEESLIYFVHILCTLTQSERDILRMLLQDMKVAQIAEARTVEVVTVKSQIQAILRKFNMSRTKAIVRLFRELGLDKIFLQ